MADPTQFTFSFGDLAKFMFAAANIHEGKWVVGFEFNVAVGPIGIKPGEAFPGAIISAQKLLLTAYAGGEDAPENLTFDAAVLNPKPR